MFPHHDDGSEESSAGAHHKETVNEPRGPDDIVRDPHCLQGLFKAEFLL